MWYPGVAGGVATADVLTGAGTRAASCRSRSRTARRRGRASRRTTPGCNPAAIVIPNNNTGTGANDGNCPLYPGVFLTDPAQGPHTYRTVDIRPNGIFQGYSWYDKHDVAPLFAFGHGLSYTRFAYSRLTVERPTTAAWTSPSASATPAGATGPRCRRCMSGRRRAIPRRRARAPGAGGVRANRPRSRRQRRPDAARRPARAFVLVDVQARLGARHGRANRVHRLVVSRPPPAGFGRGVRTVARHEGDRFGGRREPGRQGRSVPGLRAVRRNNRHAQHLRREEDEGEDSRCGRLPDNGGHPGTLLASGSLVSPTAGAWNDVSITPSTAIAAGQSYWIALLGTGGVLNLQDECCGAQGSQPSETSSSTSLSSLPATWSTGTVFPHDGPVSAYALLHDSPAG